MTDEELICAWMEPKAEEMDANQLKWHGIASEVGGGWRISGPRKLTLDALHEVEARLTDEHWFRYENLIVASTPSACDWRYTLLHADAPTRIKALATVLRKEVEK